MQPKPLLLIILYLLILLLYHNESHRRNILILISNFLIIHVFQILFHLFHRIDSALRREAKKLGAIDEAPTKMKIFPFLHDNVINMDSIPHSRNHVHPTPLSERYHTQKETLSTL